MARTPVFNLPGVVVWLAAILVAIHWVRSLLPAERATDALLAFAFIPARYEPGGAILTGGVGARFWTPLTHAFLHADWLHLVVNLVWMASFGGALARRFAALRFIILAALSAAAGAAVFFVLHSGEDVLLIGASGGVSGMMAATACFAFAPGGPLSGGGPDSYRLPAQPLLAALTSSRALSFIGVWFAINLLFGFFDGLLPGVDGAIAWEAHLGGFLAGIAAFPALDPTPGRVPPLASPGSRE
jgi:membrane associated rhomboid family serine protease